MDLIVVANWKMYKTSQEAVEYIRRLAPLVEGFQARVLIAVPFTGIESATLAAKQSRIVIGAQNVHEAKEGAHTGEISANMLKEAGASFVILGHSERRREFGETDSLIHKKMIRALQDDLQPILCVGETEEERQSGRAQAVVTRQLEAAFAHVPLEFVSRCLISYEPIWAIGSGKAATPDVAQEMHSICREVLTKLVGSTLAKKIAVLYGGSVSPHNIRGFVLEKDIDGVLVGGSSLKVDVFAAIIQHCEGVR